MKNFKPFSSKIIRLPQKDIDTDLIIPAEFLTTTTRDGLGENVFSNLRKSDPNFPKLDGRILVAGKNFGCGSSREHAVWALKQAGIDAIISSAFADIFRGNAEKNALLPIILDEKIIQNILENENFLTVDLAAQKISTDSGQHFKFEISEFSKKRLLENISDLDFLRACDADIQNFLAVRGK